jgi:hypothetical protein
MLTGLSLDRGVPCPAVAATGRLGCGAARCLGGLRILFMCIADGWILRLAAECAVQSTSDAGEDESSVDADVVCGSASADARRG